jgi:(1->4)-alpha-D-glucan 1-alpha-D-glucosylmutase
MIPRATYRLQFNKSFTFDQAAERAPYFAALGVSHIYASPILTARAGSMHGYDVVDHSRINPELGGGDGFVRMAAALKAQNIGIILDIVPNHMAVGGGDNVWWLDVLENGRASPYASFFDIDFDTPDTTLRGKILAPFLGAPYGEALRSGDLKLERADGKFRIAYHRHIFPIRPEDQAEISNDVRKFDDRETLHALLQRQNFVLAWWRSAGDRINWRRFFDVTELAGLRVERPEVLEATHQLTFDLYARGMIDGVRVDHIDGLADPAGYCRALRARLDALDAERPVDAAPGPAWLIVEKILGARETLPSGWGADGTSGYDFMNQVSALQHDPAGERPLSGLWRQVSRRPGGFESEEQAAREEILTGAFEGQLTRCAAAFHQIALREIETRDVTQAALRRAIIGIVRHLRLYRGYATGQVGSPPVSDGLRRAAALATREAPGEAWPIAFILDALTGEDAADAVRLFNQLTAPVAAKAVEDTAFYRYGRLLSRNDVGFDPGRLTISAADFHEAMTARAAAQPAAMLATATHDHKRGEDVRARLAVLSEMPQLWAAKIAEWSALNAAWRPAERIDGDECQLYQMLTGAWPLEADDDLDGFRARIAGWRLKALREAKLRTSWAAPDAGFEARDREFLDALLDPRRSATFLSSLRGWVRHIAAAGAMNALTQMTLRNTVPGIPDLYQGTEFWDFSLVDPDNRRPVDYALRAAALADEPLAALAQHWRDGRIKQRLLTQLLNLRAVEPALFAAGDYRALTVEGPRAANVLAFARTIPGRALIVAVPLHCAAAVAGADRIAPNRDWWGDTMIAVPDLSGCKTDVLTGEECEAGTSIGLHAMGPVPLILHVRHW